MKDVEGFKMIALKRLQHFNMVMFRAIYDLDSERFEEACGIFNELYDNLEDKVEVLCECKQC